ncbi:FAD/NAD(P)-binding protein [Nonomuraea sp. NPDC050783]|uniref:FAD/NAD(P)-binding protein n=1 Tax=Nonomuraea sp. NPDC050783 TaxID=3154634 RepID=UPI00346650B4
MRIAMIGGGATAVSLLDSLLAQAGDGDAALDIRVYEPAHLGHGGAFADDLDCALINLPNGLMSIRDHQRDHFLAWLRARPGGPEPRGDDFAPRRVFGLYLREHFAACREAARERGWRVTVHPETVLDVARTRDGDYAVTSDRATRTYSHVVLGVGPGGPADPYRLAGSPGFVADPYPLKHRLAEVAPDDPVLVIGTGLTAVDTVVALLAAGHRAPVTMVSRRGVLPEVLAPARDRPFGLDPERVEKRKDRDGRLTRQAIRDLLHEELTAAGFDARAQTDWYRRDRPAAAYLRHQLTYPEANAVQSLFLSIPAPLGRMIRAALRDEDVALMLNDYKPRLRSLQCPMPPRTARTLLSAMESGRLAVIPGVREVRAGRSRFTALAGDRVVTARVAVDATRAAPARSRGRQGRLVAALDRNGLASWNAYGGLRTDPATARLRPAGDARPLDVFAVGELAAGDIYYASSLPAVNRGADTVAAELLAAATPAGEPYR